MKRAMSNCNDYHWRVPCDKKTPHTKAVLICFGAGCDYQPQKNYIVKLNRIPV